VIPVNRKATESDDLLRAMVDLCDSSLAVLDESGAIRYASRAWNLRHGDNKIGESIRSTFQSSKATLSRFDEEAKITLRDDIQQILAEKEKEFHRQYRYNSPTDQLPFTVHAARVNLNESAFRVLITTEHIPRLRDDWNSHDRLSELLATTKILAWEGEVKEQRFNYVSEHAIAMLGYPVASWYEPNFFASHLHPDDLQRVLTTYQKQTRTAEHFDLTFRMLTSDGRVVWIQNLVTVVREDGRPSRMHGFMIDISEQKRAEEALKDVGGRLIAAQEEERRRIARELHDDLNQRLALISRELELLGQKIPKPLRNSVQTIEKQAIEVSTEIHRLSYRLHPSKLDHLGLPSALASLCKEVSESGGIKVQFHQTGFPATIHRDITLCLFRIAQEGLRNCVKHSGAEFARVELTKTQHAVRLLVSDNGCGFDTSPEVMEKGLGFVSMKERLHLLGGEIKVHSSPLRGTRIEVTVPLERKFQQTLEKSNTDCYWRIYETPPNNTRR
jgi:PAS domain S-box-containing protein